VSENDETGENNDDPSMERREESIMRITEADVIAEDPEANGEENKPECEDEQDEDTDQDLADRGMTDKEKDAIMKELSNMKRYKLDLTVARKDIDEEGRRLVNTRSVCASMYHLCVAGETALLQLAVSMPT